MMPEPRRLAAFVTCTGPLVVLLGLGEGVVAAGGVTAGGEAGGLPAGGVPAGGAGGVLTGGVEGAGGVWTGLTVLKVWGGTFSVTGQIVVETRTVSVVT